MITAPFPVCLSGKIRDVPR